MPFPPSWVMPNPRWLPSYWTSISFNASTQWGNNSRVHLTPFYIPARMVTSKLALYVATAGNPGSNLRLGLYGDNGRTPVGAALLGDSGNIPADTTGSKTFTFPTPLLLNKGWCWTCIETQDNVILFARSSSTLIFTDEGSEMLNSGYYTNPGFGPLQNPCPAVAMSASCRANFFLLVDSIQE